MKRTLVIGGVVGLAVVAVLGLAIIINVPWLPSGGQSVLAAVKNWFAPAPHARLLVTTDLDCDWKLDGKPRGRLRANESAPLTTGFGQHLLEAKTADGKDELRVVVELHKPEQQVAAIELEPTRQVRVEREEAQRRADAKREAEAKRAEAEREAEARGWWRDPDSGLIWARKDSGHDSDFIQAKKYCEDLRIGGNSDWRIPTRSELLSLFEYGSSGLSQPRGPVHISGRLWPWSSEDHAAGYEKYPALCVRKP